MVDVETRGPKEQARRVIAGAMMRPEQTFRFEDSVLIVEADVAAGIDGYDPAAWPELVITTGAEPTERRRDGLYGYDNFKGDYTLGCRLQADHNTICSLMDNSSGTQQGGGRLWEISWFQQEGETSHGGGSFIDQNQWFRHCGDTDPDVQCRDRFRLELADGRLTIYVNGFKYFEQTGLPPLPDELLQGELYVYFASMIVGDAAAVRFHWDHLAVNPDTGPTASPTYRRGGATAGH